MEQGGKLYYYFRWELFEGFASFLGQVGRDPNANLEQSVGHNILCGIWVRDTHFGWLPVFQSGDLVDSDVIC
jgi:hypothetical protein